MNAESFLKFPEKAGELFCLYSDSMYRTAFSVLKNPYDAEDAVQQAFVSVLLHLQSIEDPPSPRTKALLNIIAKNKALDILRSRKNEVAEPDLTENFSARTATPEEQVITTEALAVILRECSERERSIIALYYSWGYSAKEIGKWLQLRPGSVRRTLSRIRNKLRERYEE